MKLIRLAWLAILPAALLFAPASASISNAQTVVVDSYPEDLDYYDDDTPDVPDTVDDDDAVEAIGPVREQAPGTVVLGWSERNGCGAYYFWDGESCVDARQK